MWLTRGVHFVLCEEFLAVQSITRKVSMMLFVAHLVINCWQWKLFISYTLLSTAAFASQISKTSLKVPSPLEFCSRKRLCMISPSIHVQNKFHLFSVEQIWIYGNPALKASQFKQTVRTRLIKIAAVSLPAGWLD